MSSGHGQRPLSEVSPMAQRRNSPIWNQTMKVSVEQWFSCFDRFAEAGPGPFCKITNRRRRQRKTWSRRLTMPLLHRVSSGKVVNLVLLSTGARRTRLLMTPSHPSLRPSDRLSRISSASRASRTATCSVTTTRSMTQPRFTCLKDLCRRPSRHRSNRTAPSHHQGPATEILPSRLVPDRHRLARIKCPRRSPPCPERAASASKIWDSTRRAKSGRTSTAATPRASPSMRRPLR